MGRTFDLLVLPKERRALHLAAMLFWSVLLAWLLHTYVIQSPIVQGPSMAPTLNAGDRRLLLMLPYRWRDPERGEIVALHQPHDGTMIVKRIVALPNERVQFRDGKVFVNDEQLAEPYLSNVSAANTPTLRLGDHRYLVAENCYFVLGDNRAESIDSRRFGAVERSAIVGRIH